MTNKTQTILHILTILMSLSSLLTGVVPAKYAVVVLGVQGVISSIIKEIASNHNPDGTPASVAYVPPVK